MYETWPTKGQALGPGSNQLPAACNGFVRAHSDAALTTATSTCHQYPSGGGRE